MRSSHLTRLAVPVFGIATQACKAFLMPTCSQVPTAAPGRKDGVCGMAAAEARVKTNDVLVVGAGTLGTIVSRLWKERVGADGVAYAETATKSRHEELRAIGAEPFTHSTRPDGLAQGTAANIVFCVPPSKNADYVSAIRRAIELWSGDGAFVFTSSGGVYAEDQGGRVDERSAVSDSPRLKSILEAEKVVLEAGGVVVRLADVHSPLTRYMWMDCTDLGAGLYTLERGPHTFWLNRGEVTADPDGLINMLHYEDAARATVAALLHITKETEQRILLISDESPLTRRQICEAAVASPAFKGKFKMPVFKMEEGAPRSLGKVYDMSVSRKALGGWSPRYTSFRAFMAEAVSREDATV